MVFEPISGTIGAVAVVDQALARCAWVYGKYKISQAFGASYANYTTVFYTEIWGFQEIRDHTIFELSEDPLTADRKRLKRPLRTRPLQWADDLQRCEDLIMAFEVELPDDKKDEEVQGQGFNAIDSLSPRNDIEATPIAMSTTVSGTIGSSSTPPENASTPGISTLPSTVSTAGSGIEETDGKSPILTSPVEATRQKWTDYKFPRLSQWSESRKKKKESKKAKEKDKKTLGPPVIAIAEVPASITDVAVRFQDLDTSILSDRAKEIQSQTSFLHLGTWVLRRDALLVLFERIKGHREFFTSAIQIDHTKRSVASLLRAKRLEPLLARYKSTGGRLRQLTQSLASLQGIQQTSVQFMLHDDPFQLQTLLSMNSEHDQFRPESAAFYTRVETQPLTSTDEHDSSAESSSVLPACDKYLVFDVAMEQSRSSNTGRGVRIKTVEALVSPEPSTVQLSGWAGFSGHTDVAIHVFSDSTQHSAERSLYECLADGAEQRILRQHSHARFRVHLGLTIAASLMCRVQAQGPRSLEGKDLRYYPAHGESGGELEPRLARINPFAPLRIAGTAKIASLSSAMALSGRGGDTVETETAKKLGVLLYEVGAWEVVETSFPECVRSVKVKKENLALMSPIYRDVIRACTENKIDGDLVPWLFENVVEPLRRVVDVDEMDELL
ncbi:hypothetical protein B0J13DRAFT_532603 [Dactylonectria estremocensis]|uniref:Uncharacterized protein n=1 Tax=Dactylonectria estremocensis TaxID=1079267 RepID=A0A9P9DGE0_9HYPO|nr:hypothetical protein B0J13DRAFT_532603 [Dactylonectria estremocensis]